MARIVFERWQQTARFRSPLKGGEMDSQEIEVRLDPLTGHQSTFNMALEDKASILFPETDRTYLEKRAEETKDQCFLCEERWRQTTPLYKEDLHPDGRFQKGEAVLFPNLFPLAAYHAVVMLGNRHYRPLNDFPVSLLEDAFSVSLEFIRKCHDSDSQMLYFTINANYLFPAGASVIHPHFQILGSPFPGTHHKLLLDNSLSYFQGNNSCYWIDLIETEEESGDRVVGGTGSCQWYSAYSPLGANEVIAVWPRHSHVLEWNAEDVRGVAEGLSRALQAYHDKNFSTFNFSIFSGPVDRTSPEFRCFMRLVNRQNVTPHYRTDDYYFQKLLKNEIIIQRPENLASFMRGYF